MPQYGLNQLHTPCQPDQKSLKMIRRIPKSLKSRKNENQTKHENLSKIIKCVFDDVIVKRINIMQ